MLRYEFIYFRPRLFNKSKLARPTQYAKLLIVFSCLYLPLYSFQNYNMRDRALRRNLNAFPYNVK